MNNIKEMEENVKGFCRWNGLDMDGRVLGTILTDLVDELKSQADRMAQLENQIAELLGKEEKDG